MNKLAPLNPRTHGRRAERGSSDTAATGRKRNNYRPRHPHTFTPPSPLPPHLHAAPRARRARAICGVIDRRAARARVKTALQNADGRDTPGIPANDAYGFSFAERLAGTVGARQLCNGNFTDRSPPSPVPRRTAVRPARRGTPSDRVRNLPGPCAPAVLAPETASRFFFLPFSL